MSKYKSSYGFTLVEVVVSIIVLAFISISAVSIMYLSVSSFRGTYLRSQIQIESQVLESRLTDIIRESISCKYIGDGVYEVGISNGYYYIMHCDNSIYLSKNIVAVTDTTDLCMSPNNFLAKYVVDLSIEEFDGYTDEVVIDITMGLSDIVSIMSYSISPRNGI